MQGGAKVPALQQHSHEAIIDPGFFDAVQVEMRKRAQTKHRYYTPHVFSGRVFCAECGGLYGSDVCNHYIVWKCIPRHKKKVPCKSPQIRTQTIEDAFVRAINQVIDRKEEIIASCEKEIVTECDTTSIDARLSSLREEVDRLNTLMNDSITNNARVSVNQEEYNRQFSEYESRYTTIQADITSLVSHKIELQAKKNNIQNYISVIRSQERLAAFDKNLWFSCVEKLLVFPDRSMLFEFMGRPSIEG